MNDVACLAQSVPKRNKPSIESTDGKIRNEPSVSSTKRAPIPVKQSRHDNHADGDPNGLTPESVIGSLHAQHISIIFARINSSTDKMIQVFDEVLASRSAAAGHGGDPYMEEAKVKVIELGASEVLSHFNESLSSEVMTRLMEHFL